MKNDLEATIRLFEIFQQNEISSQEKSEIRTLLTMFPIAILGCDETGNSLLHLAVRHNDEEIDNILKDNPNLEGLQHLKNDDQKTAFEILVERNQKLTTDNITILSKISSDGSIESTSSEASSEKSPILPKITKTEIPTRKLSTIKEEPSTTAKLFAKKYSEENTGASFHPSQLKRKTETTILPSIR